MLMEDPSTAAQVSTRAHLSSIAAAGYHNPWCGHMANLESMGTKGSLTSGSVHDAKCQILTEVQGESGEWRVDGKTLEELWMVSMALFSLWAQESLDASHMYSVSRVIILCTDNSGSKPSTSLHGWLPNAPHVEWLHNVWRGCVLALQTCWVMLHQKAALAYSWLTCSHFPFRWEWIIEK